MSQPIHLFTIRIWQEEIGAGRRTPRGQLTLGLRGETRTFQGWSALVEAMDELLQSQGDLGNSSLHLDNSSSKEGK